MVDMGQGGHNVLEGRYLLEEQLGDYTWRASDQLTGERVVAKEIWIPSDIKPGDRNRLVEQALTEARLASMLEASAIVPMLALHVDRGCPWVITQFIDDVSSLHAVVGTHGALPLEAVVTIARDLFEAVKLVHEAGLVHSQVLPSKVLLRPDFHALLADLTGGVAKIRIVMHDPSTLGERLDMLAPEVVTGQGFGPEADLFGLGVTLYYAIEGRLPFAGKSQLETMCALVVEPPIPPVKAGPLTAMLLGLLAKRPADRMPLTDARAALAAVSETIAEPVLAISAFPQRSAAQFQTVEIRQELAYRGLPAPAVPEPGTLIVHRYRLEERIGSGGSGDVWRAHDTILNRTVAVKQFRLGSWMREDERERVMRLVTAEARHAASLHHPNIVAIHDLLILDDNPWLVMQLAGRSLAQVVQEDGPRTQRETAGIGLALLDALEAAHGAGLIHRDVKPSNVLLDTGSNVMLGDFSISATTEVDESDDLIGSPGYIAPERFLGVPKGIEADLFGLGATLYFACEGRGAFERPDPVATTFATAIHPAEPPASAGALAVMLEGLLEKDPQSRWDISRTRAFLQTFVRHDDEVTTLQHGQTLPDVLRSAAVLIGTSNYSRLPRLPGVRENVAQLATLLRDTRLWGLPADRCLVVDDPATADDFIDPISQAAAMATDVLIFYYAGHGLIHPTRGTFQPTLTHSEVGKPHTSIDYDWIRDTILNFRPRCTVILLDSCYSGRALGLMGLTSTVVADAMAVDGSYAIAAAAENELALAPEDEVHTAFTGELLRLMREGVPGGSRLLDLDAIYLHLQRSLTAKGRPEPQKRDRNSAGKLPLLRNRAAHGPPTSNPETR